MAPKSVSGVSSVRRQLGGLCLKAMSADGCRAAYSEGRYRQSMTWKEKAQHNKRVAEQYRQYFEAERERCAFVVEHPPFWPSRDRSKKLADFIREGK